jgi:hypothetical protein
LKPFSGVVCGKIMDALTAHLRRETGTKNSLAGAVVFIQRFGSGANLNVHLHIIALDGTYTQKSTGRLKFVSAKAPTEETTKRLATDIAKRINKHLVKKGFLEEHEDLMLVGNTEDLFASNADDLHLPAQAASASHRIAFGENAGKPVRRLCSSHALWPSEDDVEVSSHASKQATLNPLIAFSTPKNKLGIRSFEVNLATFSWRMLLMVLQVDFGISFPKVPPESYVRHSSNIAIFHGRNMIIPPRRKWRSAENLLVACLPINLKSPCWLGH